MSEHELNPIEQDQLYDLQKEQVKAERIKLFGFDPQEDEHWKNYTPVENSIQAVPAKLGSFLEYLGYEASGSHDLEAAGHMVAIEPDMISHFPNHEDHDRYLSWVTEEKFREIFRPQG